ncbi:cyclic nucleotide-binding domain-containing protein [Streptomyces griseoviridis]|uniref:cyclic nucleotide-binding domain-containing protein n=1 Tax=Streptomyces griseoviridis TaxID=45398 RepID=UPI0033D4F6CC
MSTTTTLLNGLPPASRDRMMKVATEVFLPAGTRVFEEGQRADRFWIIRTGTVVLDLHVPGRRAAAVETLGPGDLLGWSWLLPPYSWHLGAEAKTAVEAVRFDATIVRALCEADPAFGKALSLRVAQVVAERLQNTRVRLLDLYGPYGGELGRRV